MPASAPQVLYLSPNRIGDSVIATGILGEIQRQQPGAEVTVITSGPAAAFYRSAPGVVQVVPIDKAKNGSHWLKIWQAARTKAWDLAIDTRGSATTRLVRAKRRRIYGRHLETGTPKVEVIGRLMGLEGALEPDLHIDAKARARAGEIIDAHPGTGPILALAPIAVQPGKSWPAERWGQLVARLKAEARFDGWRFMLVGGPGDHAPAAPALAEAGERGIDFVGKGDILASAAAIGRASLFVGNDSGLMHVAAAIGTPTLGLFGPTEWWLYGPRGQKTRTLAANNEVGTFAPIEDISVDQAVAAVIDLYDNFGGASA